MSLLDQATTSVGIRQDGANVNSPLTALGEEPNNQRVVTAEIRFVLQEMQNMLIQKYFDIERFIALTRNLKNHLTDDERKQVPGNTVQLTGILQEYFAQAPENETEEVSFRESFIAENSKRIPSVIPDGYSFPFVLLFFGSGSAPLVELFRKNKKKLSRLALLISGLLLAACGTANAEGINQQTGTVTTELDVANKSELDRIRAAIPQTQKNGAVLYPTATSFTVPLVAVPETAFALPSTSQLLPFPVDTVQMKTTDGFNLTAHLTRAYTRSSYANHPLLPSTPETVPVVVFDENGVLGTYQYAGSLEINGETGRVSMNFRAVDYQDIGGRKVKGLTKAFYEVQFDLVILRKPGETNAQWQKRAQLEILKSGIFELDGKGVVVGINRKSLRAVVGRNLVKGTERTLFFKPQNRDQQAGDSVPDTLIEALVHLTMAVGNSLDVESSLAGTPSVSPTTIPTSAPSSQVLLTLTPTSPPTQAPTKQVEPTLAPTATEKIIINPPEKQLSLAMEEFARASGVKEIDLLNKISRVSIRGTDGSDYSVIVLRFSLNSSAEKSTLSGDFPILIYINNTWQDITMLNTSPFTDIQLGVFVGGAGSVEKYSELTRIKKNSFSMPSVYNSWKTTSANGNKGVIDDYNKAVAFGSKEIIMHPLIWETDFPDSVSALSGNALAKAILDHVQLTIDSYPRVTIFTVNEVSDTFLARIGSKQDQITFFNDIKKILGNRKLVLNDTLNHGSDPYNGNKNRRTESSLREFGQSIDMIGVQLHIDAGYIPPEGWEEMIYQRLKYYSRTYPDKKILISEFDVNIKSLANNRYVIQAEIYEQLIRGIRRANRDGGDKIVAINFMGIDDSLSPFVRDSKQFGYSPLAAPTMFDDKLQKKLAWFGAIKGLVQPLP